MTSTDPRTPLEAFRDALVDAMAAEMSMLRARRESWEVAADGIMSKMGVRALPVLYRAHAVLTDAVLFTRQARADLPEVPKENRGEAEQDPVVEVGGDAPGGIVQGDGAPGAEGGPA